MKLIQANARVPADGRPVLLKAAALMRADPSFTAKLEAFLAGDEPGTTWRNEMAAMSARIVAVEALLLRETPVSSALNARPSCHEAVRHLAGMAAMPERRHCPSLWKPMRRCSRWIGRRARRPPPCSRALARAAS